MSASKGVALVTGASSGIGAAIAERLLADGYVVYGAARRVEQMKTLVDKGMIALQMDVTSDDDVSAGIETIAKAHGGVDVLVNNAGFGCYGAMEDTTLDDARYQFEVNLFGVARVTKAVLPHMRGKRAGTIVNISSMGGKIYTPLGSWYHASKHALEGWSDCLRLELAQFDIGVVVIEPGLITTEFGDVLVGPMMERSGEGPYAGLAHRVAAATSKAYEKGGGSDPSVVAGAVAKALRTSNPKTRYVVGKMARPVITLRKWFGDRVYDRGVMSRM